MPDTPTPDTPTRDTNPIADQPTTPGPSPAMAGPARKAAVIAYKERKADPGVYVLQCRVPGPNGLPRIWVGATPTLHTAWNRLSFTLRHGGATNRSLQAAWAAHGPDSFTFAVLERLEPEAEPHFARTRLRKRAAHWRAALAAEPL